MEQLPLFDSGELMQIRHYLTVWNETERTKRLAEIKTRDLARREGKPSGDGGRKV